MTIDTARMRLRPLDESDLDVVAEMFSDPEVMRFSVTGTRNRDETRAWFDKVLRVAAEEGLGFLAATRKTDGEYLGHAGLLPQVVDGKDELEIAYWFRRIAWGQGLATEAARALRDFATTELGRTRLVSIIDPGNTGSRRVAEKNGMRLEKTTVWKGIEVCVYALDTGNPDA